MIGIFTASAFVFETEEYAYCMAKWSKYLAVSFYFFFLNKIYFLIIVAFTVNADIGSWAPRNWVNEGLKVSNGLVGVRFSAVWAKSMELGHTLFPIVINK